MIYSRYARNLLADAALRGGTITFPATYYIALLAAKPGLTDTYQEIGNVTPNGYARYAIPNSNTTWSEADVPGSMEPMSVSVGPCRVSNNILIQFPAPTGDWKHGSPSTATPIKAIALFDSATIGAGNMWLWAMTGAAKTVNAGDLPLQIAMNTLAFTFDK